MPDTSLLLILSIPVLLVSLAGTGLVRHFALARSLLDLPVERSSHSLPTPTAGGIALVCAFYLGLLLQVFQPVFFQTDSFRLPAIQALDPRELAALSCGLALAFIGLLDDLHQLDFRWRIVIHFTAATAVVLLPMNLPALDIGVALLDGPVLILLLVLGLVWVTNLYNFMDGTDGLAASECCFITMAAALFLVAKGDTTLAGLSLLLFAASAGFLFWNWAPARIFMGDTGSGFLGFILGTLALLSYVHGSMQLWSWVLLAGVFIADATTTVIRRMLRGERWYQAHCTHAYQHAARRWGHRRLASGVLLINLCWLLPLSWFAEMHPEYGVYLAFFGIVPLFVLSDRLGAGRASDQGNLQGLKD